MNLLKINFKKENGSISLFILVSVLFFLVAVVSVGISLKNKAVSMNKKFNTIKQTYEVDVGNEEKISTDEEKENTQNSETNSSEEVVSNYGRIDVIWLSGTSSTVSSVPNEPNLGDKMTKVTWSEAEDANGNTTGWTEDSTAKSNWYNYVAGTGNDENLSSMWANAKNSDGSYFVWIPRYAYRITYYSDSSYKTVTGYYDGRGMWSAKTGKTIYVLDNGIETVDYNGKKYIVHPAFTSSVDNGGWNEPLKGFWMAKYEMSRKGATKNSTGTGYSTTFKSVPNVQSARSITIGNMYDVAYNYDRTKESHMAKNSEWGATAYLSFSQYGRNGHEVDINNSSSCITGNGGGSTSINESVGITNAYNTIIGAKASTTGNIYGIYDMSGGAWEYTASFDQKGDYNYVNGESYGKNMTKNVKNSEGGYTSSKYITVYNQGTNTDDGEKIYKVGKIGDGTKETYNTSRSGNYSWYPNGDYTYTFNSNYPFFTRGGYYHNGMNAGIFFSNYNEGSNGDSSFRTVLCIEL